MLLVDSVYINMGGGLSLLKYLVENLHTRHVVFMLLVDERIKDAFPEVKNQIVLSPSEKSRRTFYKSMPSDVTSVFCFGNVPPPFKLRVPVYTYFHNINMLTLADSRGWKQKIKFFLKREYIRVRRKNSDEWFVQTTNTANELKANLNIPDKKVKLYPFYRPPVINSLEKERNDYIFVGNDSGSKGHRELIAAWKKLHDLGIDRTLHLTVSADSPLCSIIDEMAGSGVKIVNHGIVPLAEVFALYARCKATVYPSRNESFGLGIIEAIEAGCDVVGSDLPFMHAVCTPSEVFNPYSVDSIVEAVMRYEATQNQTDRKVSDMIDELISDITK